MCDSCSDLRLMLRAPWTWPGLSADDLQGELEAYLELNVLHDDHGEEIVVQDDVVKSLALKTSLDS